MKTKAGVLFIALLAVMAGDESTAQDITLKGRSAVELSIGLWGGAKASNTIDAGGVQSEAGTNGFSDGIGYAYWLREHLALTVTAG